MSNLPAKDLPPDIRLEYPYAGNTIKLPTGAEMHYLDEGQGPTVLMLHGNPTWSFLYRKLIDHLVGQGFRCVAPDHIGCGLSEKPKNYNYTLKQRIQDIAYLVDYLDLQEFNLVVHDWGGAIGCGLAWQRPKALKRLVLMNTAAFRSKWIPIRIALVKIPVIGQAIIRGLNGFAGPAVNMAVRKPLSSAVRHGFLWPYRSWAERIAVWNFVKDIPLEESHRSYQTLYETEEGLSNLKEKPVYMLWGEKDFCFSMKFFHKWKSFFPNAKTRTLPSAGHYVLEDADASEYQHISEFLSS